MEKEPYDRLMQPTRVHPFAGALYMLAASVAMALVGTTVKWSTEGLPAPVVVFFRNLFGLLVLVPWLLAPGGISVRTRVLPLHLARCLFGLGAMYTYFFALSHLHLSGAVALNFTSPLWIPFIARLWLGERFTVRMLIASVIGLAGVWFIRTPGSGAVSMAGAAGLASAFFASAALVGVRRLTLAGEPTGRIVFYFAFGSALFTAVPLPFCWETPTGVQWLSLALTGALASLAQFLLSRGFARAPAGIAAVFYYATVPAAALLGWLLWGETLTLDFAIGAGLICAAGIAAAQKARATGSAPPES